MKLLLVKILLLIFILKASESIENNFYSPRFKPVKIPIGNINIYYDRIGNEIMLKKCSYDGWKISFYNNIFEYTSIFELLIDAINDKRFNLFYFDTKLGADKNIVFVGEIPIILEISGFENLYLIALSVNNKELVINLNCLQTLCRNKFLTKGVNYLVFKTQFKEYHLKTSEDIMKIGFGKNLSPTDDKVTKSIKDTFNSIFKEEVCLQNTKEYTFSFYRSSKQVELSCNGLLKTIYPNSLNRITNNVDSRLTKRENDEINSSDNLKGRLDKHFIHKNSDVIRQKRKMINDDNDLTNKKSRTVNNNNINLTFLKSEVQETQSGTNVTIVHKKLEDNCEYLDLLATVAELDSENPNSLRTNPIILN